MSQQILYKYRGLEPWEFLLDILVNNRLYAARFQNLNDPMEGVFTYSQDKVSPSFIEQMVNHKTELGICSLSKAHDSTVMWSYYAAAHKGVVIGVSVAPNSEDIIEVSSVSYSKENVFRGFLGSDASTEARKILSKKLSAWRHEGEVRVFSRSSFVPVEVSVVYLGCLMPKQQKELLRCLISRLNPDVQVLDMDRDSLDSRLYT